MRALLDACVLYPAVPRGILLGAAEAGLLMPLWSPRILEEWARTAARRGDARPPIAELVAAWPDAMQRPDPAVEAGLALPDPSDAHVLAAAIAGGADTLVTFNLRDFPRGALAARGIAAEDPDALLHRLWLRAPAAIEAAAQDAMRGLGPPGRSARTLLKRARLPRLAKALAA
jgi:hypothetical protein